jgi:hypothetical protein
MQKLDALGAVRKTQPGMAAGYETEPGVGSGF